MADESAIRKSDIIEQPAIVAPLELAENLKVLKKEMIDISDTAKKMADALRSGVSGGSSLPKAKKDNEELTESQRQLINVQKQIEVQVAKNNEAYLKQQIALQKVKQELKDSIALGEKDALAVNKQTASREVLGKALEKNQREYSQLNSEEERNSARGKLLFQVIQQQSKEFNELSTSIGITKQNVGNYTGSILEAYYKINQLKNANKELLVLQGKLTQSTAQERAQYQELNIAIQNNLTQINQYNTAITTTGSKMSALVGQFLGAVGLIGVVYLAVNAFKSFIAANTELEKSLSDLQALTGASSEDLQTYREAAISIGVETKRSAKDVVESFKLIGGARPELLQIKEDLIDVTKQSIILANASGLELPKAAEALAGALNQLELPAKDAGRVVNVLAAAAKEGAAEIPDISESYKDFGAVLRGVNGSVEEGAALIEVLADRQIKGGEAGTALRNVLLRLSAVNALPKKAQEQLAKFGVDIVKVADNTVPLAERLKELGKISGDATALVKVFGVENFVAGNIVLNNIPRFEQLTKAVTGTQEAYRQAAVATNNLQGDVDEAKATVGAFAEEVGGHTQSALRSFVQGFTFIINVLRATPKFLSDNKALFLALGVALIGFNSQLIITNLNLIRLNALQLVTIARLAAMRTATIAFFTTLAANPIGLVLVGLSALIAAVAVYDKNSQRTVELAERTAAVNKNLNQELDRTSKAYDDLTISIDEYLKLSKTQQDSIVEQVEFQKRYSLVLLNRIKIQREAVAATASELTGFQKLKAGILSYFSIAAGASSALESSIENVAAATNPIDEKIKTLEDQINKFDSFLTDSKAQQVHETEVAAKKEADAAYKLNKFRIEQAIKAQDEIFKNEFAGEQERLDANGKRVQLENSLALLERNHELASEKLTASDKILIQEEYNAKRADNIKKGAKERSDLEDKIFKEEMAIVLKNLQETVDAYKLSLDTQVALIKDSVNKGVITRKEGEKQIKELVIKNAQDLTKETIKQLQNVLDSEHLTAEERKKIAKQIAELQIQLINEVYDAGKNNSKSFLEQLKEDLQKALTIYEQWSQAVTSLIQNLTVRRTASIDKEIAASEKQKNKEILLAGNNENAKARIELEAEKRRETLEKRRVEALRKAAIYEKAIAVVQAGIKATLAVLNELSSGDPYTAFARAAAAAALGAVEVAAIVAKPIPSYELGTLNHPGGPARVGEAGSELVETPSGKSFLTPSRTTIIPSLEKGSKVYPHGETIRRLALAGAANYGGIQENNSNGLIEIFTGEIKELKKAVINSRQQSSSTYFEHNVHVLHKVSIEKENFIKRQRSKVIIK